MVLQITNDLSGSSLYKNLFQSLDFLGVDQIVYHPLRDKSRIGKNNVLFECSESRSIYSPILNRYSDRIFYQKKVRKIFNDVEKNVNLAEISFIHAHTWYSDGGVAYLLKKKYNIPYIVAIRSSDIVFFHKFLIWHRTFGLKILENAERIIFISESYHKLFLDKIKPNNLDPNKIEVIPNGIDQFWLENSRNKIKLASREDYDLQVLYVGQFIKRKNVEKLIKAVALLNKKSIKTQLHLVGDFNKAYFDTGIISNFGFVKLWGEIKDKSELLNVFRKADVFAMPSVNETFGLVYIEALSQGLPILYTKDDGIDGFYLNVGESVNKPVTAGEIYLKLKIMYESYDSYNLNLNSINENHNWKKIASRYNIIYGG